MRLGALCIGCGYDLSGLGSGGRCPECGLSVGRSLRSAVAAGPPAYLVRVQIAAGFLMVAFMVCLAAICIGLAATGLSKRPQQVIEWAVTAGGAGVLVACPGFWLIGWPEGVRAVRLGAQGVVLRLHAAPLAILSVLVIGMVAGGSMRETAGVLSLILWTGLSLNGWGLALLICWWMLALSNSVRVERAKRAAGLGAIAFVTLVVAPVSFWAVFAEDRVNLKVVRYIPACFAVFLACAGAVVPVFLGMLMSRVGDVLARRR